MRVAIHQPNYFPWLGYFFKIARSDTFIFLDDVQYSKNSYINRVQIQKGESSRWLTTPVSFRFGDPINAVQPANDAWRRAHIDLLFNSYRQAAYRKSVLPLIAEMLESAPHEDIARINASIIERVLKLLKIERTLLWASGLGTPEDTGDDRLIKLVSAVSPEASYLSGKGGANYQNEDKFTEAGIALEYAGFAHPVYEQGGVEFCPGRSVLDALLHLGVDRTRELVLGNN